MIAVKTPLGKQEHLARSMTAQRTFCGLAFSVGFDATRELRREEVPTPLCQSCAAVRHRRMRNAQ